ncbi:hypothetical protein SAMN05880501_11549 [Ureibacillus xyleni]|uniref:Uncharacterized protein n=1 Tax=Ureibacillus xyleni TaxID=614648 RepID=A0A285TQC4_9BACL|nr:hypothetical protein SAMN05880501_11549 [Ureibacillus xyleni]
MSGTSLPSEISKVKRSQVLSKLKNIRHQNIASHSQLIYGKLVETREPYSRYYMSDILCNVKILLRMFSL